MIGRIYRYLLNYSDMPTYGASEIVKKYTGFPKFLALPCHMEHGWTPFEKALVSDLETSKNLMLVYSERRKKAWQKSSHKKVEVLGAPFVVYRHLSNISKSKDARGTVAFPSHSTDEVVAKFDIDSYCLKLKRLPKKFHPITICIYFLDIKRGRDKIYEKHGFKVVSAGSRHDLSFPQKLYSILSAHKYSTSNDVGSYTFFSIELGIPFFLHGSPAIGINEEGKDPNIGKTAKCTDYPIGTQSTKLFDTGPVCSISDKQKNFVLSEIYPESRITPVELRKLLFKYYFKNLFFLKTFFPHLALLALRKLKYLIER